MDKKSLIEKLSVSIPKDIIRCKNTKIKFLQIYRLGKLYIDNEVLRRLTGSNFDIAKAYFHS